MSNFKIGYNTIQHIATATANLTASTTRVLANLFSGSRSDRFELATASTDILTVNYDLGASVTKTASFLAIMRAKLLHRNDCTGVRLRGSTQSATLPSTLTPTAWFDPNRGVTTVAGAVSQWNDLSGNNYHASQGTAASRPLLSRADNQENLVAYSNNQANAAYTTDALTLVTANSVLDSDGLLEGTTIQTNNVLTRHARRQTVVGSNRPTNTPIILSVEVKKSNHRYIWVGDQNHSLWHGTCFDFDTATLGTQANLTSAVVTALSNSWYRITIGYNVSDTASSGVGVWFNNTNASTSPISHAPVGTEEIYIAKFALRASTADNSYLRNTGAYPLFKGINGNRAIVSDGTDDYLLANGISAAITGTDKAYTLFFLTNCFSTTALEKNLISFGKASSATPYITHRYYSDTIDSAMRDDAATSVNPNFNGMTPTSTQVVTIKTTGVSLTVYKNGTAISTSAFDVGATTLDTCAIGNFYRNSTPGAGSYYQGYIGEVLVFNSALSDANRQAVEAYLTTKYITTPIVQLDTLSTQTLMGPNDEDYWTVFTESAAFRHYWLEFVNEGTASKYNCAKAFFGKALDFGREPQLPISIDQSRQNVWSREAALSTSLNIGPVSDTDRATFLEVVKDSDVMPVVALDPATYVFNDSKGMHCKITDHNVDPFYGADNDITITLEEEI